MLKKVIISLFLICSISIFACQYTLPNGMVIRFTGVNFDSNKQPVTSDGNEYTTNVVKSSLPMTFWFKKSEISDTKSVSTTSVSTTTICFTVCGKESDGTLNSLTNDKFYPVPLATKEEVRIPNTSNEFKLFGNYILTKNMVDSYIQGSTEINKGDYIIIIFSYTNESSSSYVGFGEDNLTARTILNQIKITNDNKVTYTESLRDGLGNGIGPIGPGNCLIIEYTGVSRIIGR